MHKEEVFTKLIHENCSLVMAFAFSRTSLQSLIEEKFHGEWKYLRKACYDLAEERADKALLELATQLRILDNNQNIAEYLKQNNDPGFGTVINNKFKAEDLHFRDMTNKIIHAERFAWVCTEESRLPYVVCEAADNDRWKWAEIELIALAAICGELMF